jgi:hypothetical protein
MSLRRRDSRMEVGNTDGVLRVWQDVSGQLTANGDYLVISNEARLKGERLTMYLATSEQPVDVTVLESRPRMVNGLVCHQLRLQPVNGGSSHSTEPRGHNNLETE